MDQLDEIDRRGFLKGLGAAAATGVAGSALAQSDDELDKIRQDNIERIKKLAGATTANQQVDAKSTTINYAEKIRRAFKPNVPMNGRDDLTGREATEVEIKVDSSGRIISRKILRTTGSRLWDSMVLTTIDKTEFLPRDIDGRIPPILIISFLARDVADPLKETSPEALDKIDQLFGK